MNPQLVVAASVVAAEGTLVNAPEAAEATQGLFYSSDAGSDVACGEGDGWEPGDCRGWVGATARGRRRWFGTRRGSAFWRQCSSHGYYESSDGANWTRLAAQPGAGTDDGRLARRHRRVQVARCFAGRWRCRRRVAIRLRLSVDSANRDEGLYRDVCGLNGTACAGAEPVFGTRLASAALEQGSGSTVIAQGDYNLTLAAAAQGADTDFVCGDDRFVSVQRGRGMRAARYDECGKRVFAPGWRGAGAACAGGSGDVAVYGERWRNLPVKRTGVNETGAPCSAADAGHFDDLNGGIGSLAEVVSFAEDPVDAGTLLAGLGALGTGGTGNAGGAWAQLSAGEGGTVAIDAEAPANWYVSTSAGVSVAHCTEGRGVYGSGFYGHDHWRNAGGERRGRRCNAPYLAGPGGNGRDAGGHVAGFGGGRQRMGGNVVKCECDQPAAGRNGRDGVQRDFSCGADAGRGRRGKQRRSNAQNNGSEVLYAGMAGALDGGGAVGGHVFLTTAANLASNATVWTDAAKGTVVNDQSNAGVFNPGGFDLSSLAVDTHDATGKTVYATVMGFAGNGVNAAHVYRSVDGGAHWTNISANLPNAPANSVVVDPNDANTLYVALDTGVYVTTQVTSCASANCWSVFGSSLPNAPAVELAAAAGMATGDGRVGELRVATYGRGIWQVPLLTAISPAAPAILLNPGSLVFADAAGGIVERIDKR